VLWETYTGVVGRKICYPPPPEKEKDGGELKLKKGKLEKWCDGIRGPALRGPRTPEVP